MPPATYGSLKTKTSPSWMSSPKSRISACMASGNAPKCSAMVRPCAMTRPCRSHRPVEYSIESRTIELYAVRRITSAISSAMDESAFLTTSRVTGSALFMRQHHIALRVERRAPAGRHHARRIVLLDDERAMPRRGELGAADDARRRRALPRPEVRVALSARRGAARRDIARAPLDRKPRHDSQRDALELLGLRLVTVSALVLVAEVPCEAAEIGLPGSDRRGELVRLPGIAQVGEARELDALRRMAFGRHAIENLALEGFQAFAHLSRWDGAQAQEECADDLVLDARMQQSIGAEHTRVR